MLHCRFGMRGSLMALLFVKVCYGWSYHRLVMINRCPHRLNHRHRAMSSGDDLYDMVLEGEACMIPASDDEDFNLLEAVQGDSPDSPKKSPRFEEGYTILFDRLISCIPIAFPLCAFNSYEGVAALFRQVSRTNTNSSATLIEFFLFPLTFSLVSSLRHCYARGVQFVALIDRDRTWYPVDGQAYQITILTV